MDMIINLNREPKYSLYNIGSIIIKQLKDSKNMDIGVLYSKIRLEIDQNLHIDFLYYALDWLYMLSIIEIDENRVVLC
ncbi:ABC-three component system middle component 6 [Bacillus sp. WLY-B-L8]|uniref:ABC-three component system middle component 6 n=1 Tax=Bacillus multifaciens TaxID=3068506 RepID=UPI003531E6D9